MFSIKAPFCLYKILNTCVTFMNTISMFRNGLYKNHPLFYLIESGSHFSADGFPMDTTVKPSASQPYGVSHDFCLCLAPLADTGRCSSGMHIRLRHTTSGQDSFLNTLQLYEALKSLCWVSLCSFTYKLETIIPILCHFVESIKFYIGKDFRPSKEVSTWKYTLQCHICEVLVFFILEPRYITVKWFPL